MTLCLGDIAPDFTAETTEGTIRFYDWSGDSWVLFLSHPRDFTSVCTTELGYVARIKPEFDKRKVKIIAISVDPLDAHLEWLSDIEKTQGHAPNFPIIADADASIASMYGMIHPNMDASVTIRSVYIIGPDKRIRLMLVYPESTGRNFDEILRVISALQLTEKFAVVTPANWRDGQDVLITRTLTEEDARKHFPGGWRELNPYIRLVPQPR